MSIKRISFNDGFTSETTPSLSIPAGRSIYTGDSVPNDLDHSNGDVYLRSNGDIYLKTAGVWVLDSSITLAASAISNIPTGNVSSTNIQNAINELQSDIDAKANPADIANAITNLVDSSPATLDTLNELAAALGDDPAFATTVSTSLGNRLRVDTASQGLNGTQKTNAKTNIDLQNVDNTSDVNKPVSTAQQTALDLKVNTTGGSVITPARLDVKQDTKANLTTYALTASNGQFAFATDTKEMLQVVDTLLVPVGGGDTLQDIYENSTTSEIETNVTNGALDLKRGSASDSDDVLRILNNAGVVVAQTNALGQHNTMYSSPENMLKNGSLELPSIADWTCTVGTCTRTTTSGEFSHGTAALKVALSAQAMNVSQTVTTPSGIQKQGYTRVIYRVPATMADFQICTLVDAAEQTCVPTANLIKDDTFRSIEIPLTFGTTSAGIKFKTTSSYTATAYFDGVILSQGLGLQNLQGDYLYSAKISGAGAITDESSDFITTCSASAGKTTCQFATGRFTVIPNCWAITRTTSGGTISETVYMDTSNYSTTEVAFKQVEGGSSSSDPANLFCMKTGNDYLASSANVYSQASGNYDWTNTTVNVLTNLGTSPSPATVGQCKHSRVGGDLLMDCSFTSGTSVPAALGSIDLPNSLTIDTARIIAQNTTAAAGQKVGTIVQSAAGNIGHVVTALGTSTSKVYLSSGVTASNTLVPTNSNGFISASTLVSVSFRVPISGWTNSNVIVGSFEGMYQSKNIIYKNSTAQSIPTSTSTIVNFGTVENDTTGFVTTGASWKFQPTVAGFYRVSSAIQFASNNYGSSVIFESNLYKNGSVLGGMGYFQNSATGVNVTPNLTGSRSVYLNGSSDYVDIRVYQTSGGPQPLTASAQYNHISISREGI